MKKTAKSVGDAIGEKLQRKDEIAKRLQDNGSLTAEEKAEFRKIVDEEIPSLQEELLILRDAESAEVRANQIAPPQGTAGNKGWSNKDEKDLSGFRLTRALNQLSNSGVFEGIEKEVHEEGVRQSKIKGHAGVQGFALPSFAEMRGQTATGQTSATGDQGGKTIETSLGDLIEMFWSNSIADKVQATRFTDLQGNVDFPVQTTKLAVQERTEIQELTDQEILFSSISMTPNRRGVTIPYSKQFLIQTSIAVESFLRQQILRAFGAKTDVEIVAAILAAVTSPGAVGGNNGGLPNYNHIVDLEGAIDSADANTGGMAFLTNTKVRSTLKKIQKFDGTNGQAIWESDNTLIGYPAIVSNYVSSTIEKGTSGATLSAILFGNWNDLYIGQWGVIDFIVDNITLKKKAQIEITANTFWDIKVARASSFTTMEDVVTVLS